MKKVLVFITGRGCASFPAPRRRARARRQRGRSARAVGTRDERFPPFPLFFSSRDQKPRPPFFLATRREPPFFNPLPSLPPSLTPKKKSKTQRSMLCQADPELARSFLARSLEGASVLSELFMSSTNGSLIGSLIGCLRLPQGTECSRMSFDAQLPLPRRGPLCRFQRLRALRQRFFFSIIISEQHHCKATTTTPKTFPEEVRFRDCITARRKSAQRGTGQGLGA